MNTLRASQILDQVMEANDYTNKVSILVRQIFRTKKISSYEYERLINMLSCNILINHDIQKNIKNYIETESEIQINNIDVRR